MKDDEEHIAYMTRRQLRKLRKGDLQQMALDGDRDNSIVGLVLTEYQGKPNPYASEASLPRHEHDGWGWMDFLVGSETWRLHAQSKRVITINLQVCNIASAARQHLPKSHRVRLLQHWPAEV